MVYSLRTHGFGMQGSGFGRGVRHFGRHTNMNVSIFNNRTTIINTCNHGFGGFSGFGFGGMGLFSGLFSMFQQFPMFQFPMFQQAAPAAPAPQTTPPPATEVKTEVKTEEVPKNDGQGGDPAPTYEIETQTVSNYDTVTTIRYGGPWHYVQYYNDANGKQLKPGDHDYNAIMNQLISAMRDVEGNGMQKQLPKTITIDNKTYSLNPNNKPQEGKKGKTNARYSTNVPTSTQYRGKTVDNTWTGEWRDNETIAQSDIDAQKNNQS